MGSEKLERWANRTFSLALLMIAAWFATTVISRIIAVAESDGSRTHPHGTGVLYGAMSIQTVIAVMAAVLGWRKWHRRARLMTKLIVLALVMPALGLAIALTAPWGLAWSAVVAALLVVSVVLERKLPPFPEAPKAVQFSDSTGRGYQDLNVLVGEGPKPKQSSGPSHPNL